MRKIVRIAALAALGVVSAGTAVAQVRMVRGIDTQARSSFLLDFGDPIGQSGATITTTTFDLQLDPTAGLAGFEYYYQTVNELILPLPVEPFFVSTGPMLIEIVPGTSSGAFDPATNTYTTQEEYAISFTNDLSVLGFQSPAIFPATSTGTLVGDISSGQITMVWTGSFALEVPGQPPLDFTYTCNVNVDHAEQAACSTDPCAGDANRDCGVDFSDLSQTLRNFGRADFLITTQHGDADSDQDVDLTDLAIMLANFGQNCR